jgi:hypothetical protein
MNDDLVRYTTTILAIAAGTASGLYAIIRVLISFFAKKVADLLNGCGALHNEIGEMRREIDNIKQQLDTVKDILYSTIEIIEQNGSTTKVSAKKRTLRRT